VVEYLLSMLTALGSRLSTAPPHPQKKKPVKPGNRDPF
jgi:hypothetical protein